MKNKKNIPEISDAELKVMKILWQEDKDMTSSQIIKSLASDSTWSAPTIKTLIHRLKKKGAIKSYLTGKDYLYSPDIPKSSIIKKESNSFLKKFFNGATAPMISHFVQSENLSHDEVNEIKLLLDEISKRK